MALCFISPKIIVIAVIHYVCAESCEKATFLNTRLKFSMDEFGEYAKIEDFTGCISPQSVSEQIKVIECYNQTLPFIREQAIMDMLELQSLIFMDNNINKVMWAAFVNLPQLEVLTLSKNKIKTIDVGVFSLVPSVSVLNLDGNRLAYLGHGIFSGMPNLRILRLYDNQLDTIEEQWFDINSTLSIIDLSHNLIRRVHREVFVNLRQLEVIDLSNNRILTVDSNAMQGLSSLVQLDLSKNRLVQLAGDVFQPLVNLGNLHLHENNLTYIHIKVLEGISPTLQEISIYSNPWQCACYHNIMTWVASRNSSLKVDASLNCILELNPVCVYPQNSPNKCLEDVDDDLDSLFYDNFNYEHKTCDLDFSHP